MPPAAPPTPSTPTTQSAILVIHFANRHYVMRDGMWSPEALASCGNDDAVVRAHAMQHVADEEARWSKTRAQALVLAHDMDNAVKTAWGVREVFFPTGHKRQKVRGGGGGDEEEA